MNFSRGTIRSSPYIGIFSCTTEDICLLPHNTLPKEQKAVEQALDVEAIKAMIGGSTLLGVLAKGMGRKIAVSSITEDSEVKMLESKGLDVIRVAGYTATGNLIAMNKNAGITSPLLKDGAREQLEAFFGIKFHEKRVANSDVVGACLTVTNKGFIAHPNISEDEFGKIEKIFGTTGIATTANYGDLFVGNSVVANSKGVIAGSLTSGIEMGKIDEGLRGE
ncbi:MAG: translation initiation factor IF-6 [archaeon]|nr:translation initiation factor IF-6 [archaeon]